MTCAQFMNREIKSGKTTLYAVLTQCNEFSKQGNGVSAENRVSPGRVMLTESYMQQKDLDESSEKGSVLQKQVCKFCGRRACKIGLSKEQSERARSPEMQPPSCQAPSTENVMGGLRQLTLQQQAQVEKSAASNVRSCKPSQAPNSTPGSGRILEPEVEYSEIESTDDTGSRYQRRKRALGATALKLWAKLSPPPVILTIFIAILAVLISCTSVQLVTSSLVVKLLATLNALVLICGKMGDRSAFGTNLARAAHRDLYMAPRQPHQQQCITQLPF